MPHTGWRSVSIPEEMVKKIKEIVDQRPALGYRSIAEFIVAAIRRHPDYRREANT